LIDRLEGADDRLWKLIRHALIDTVAYIQKEKEFSVDQLSKLERRSAT
jgi:hypothetical protein